MVKWILECSTGRQFPVDMELLKKSVVLDSMIKDLGAPSNPDVELDEDVLPFPNISERCMEKMIEWLEQHKDDPEPAGGAGVDDFVFQEHLTDWDLTYLQIDDATLFELIMAANFLEIKGLLELTTTYVGKMIAELKTPEEIRQRFNIENDLTPEDLEQIKEESKHWLDDDDGDQKMEESPE